MDRESLLAWLKKKLGTGDYIAFVADNESCVPLLLDIIETDKGSTKFLCEKIVRGLSETRPEVLYPYFDRMARLMDSQNNFIKYGFLLTLPNMLAADPEEKWNSILGKYLSFLDTEQIPVYGNVVSNLWKILKKYPGYEEIIVPKLLSIDSHVFMHKNAVSPECVNVAKGHILDCFEKLYASSRFKKEMLCFAEESLDNSRNQVRIKAKALIKKHKAPAVSR